MLSKRAEITSSQIVSIIILIVSFIVLLFLILQITNNESGTDREICKTSVSLRHSFNFGPLQGSKILPLKCKTEKICVTSSKDKCENDFGSSKDLQITKIKVSDPEKNKEKVKEEILDTFSEALLNCHTMLGEGKLNFLPSKTWEHNYCIVCSTISFNEEVKNAYSEGIDYLELYRAMENKRAGDSNYLDRTYGIQSVAQLEADFALLKQRIDEGEKSKDFDSEDVRNELDNWKFQIDNEQAILVQVVKDGSISAKFVGVSAGGVVAGGGILLGVALSSTGVGSIVGVPLMIVSGAALGATAVVVGGITYFKNFPGGGKYSAPTIVPYDANSLKNLGCDSFENLP